jgi:Transposase.
MGKLNETQRIDVLIMIGCGDRIRTQNEVCEMFNLKYPDTQITRSTVSKIERKFREAGHVRDLPRSGRPSVSDDKKLNVLLSIEENPHKATQEIALDNEIAKASVRKILKSENYHPYKLKLIHELNEDDSDRRLEFCETLMNFCNNDHLFKRKIIFSDESTFCLNGVVNRQNCRYWSTTNPNWATEAHTQYPQSVNVWAGIVNDRIIGPYFIDGNLTGERYLAFLRNQLLPYLCILFPNANNLGIPEESMWFQQVGAPSHYSRDVRQYLNQVFPARWIGRRGRIEWPARSPDITPMDFFYGVI